MNTEATDSVDCPVCGRGVPSKRINGHLDSDCKKFLATDTPSSRSQPKANKATSSSPAIAPIFKKTPVVSKKVQAKRPIGEIDNLAESEPVAIDVDDVEIDQQAESSHASNPPPSKRPRGIQARLKNAAPLAEKMRPSSIDDVVGHTHITGHEGVLRGLMRSGSIGSLILWGPPGCGKTTIARLLAKEAGSRFIELSATSSGTQDVRTAFEDAKNALKLTGNRTILFMDEIHRFNKSQQDVFLPYVEQGLVQLVGATTENPSFKVNNALLSRCRVIVLERLTDNNVREVLENALAKIGLSSNANELPMASSSPSSGIFQVTDPSASRQNQQPPTKILNKIVSFSLGDARTALSLLEIVVNTPPQADEAVLIQMLRSTVIARYDRTGDSHFDLISALHKSVRGGDGTAALYWLARMLTAGEDPLYIARRCIVIASEDVGLANDRALPLAIATHTACTVIGMPECRINLAHLVAYLAESPKSTRSYEAYNRAEEAAKATPTLGVPMQIRNAPTRLMKDLGYGEDYHYNPSYAHPVHNSYLPPELAEAEFLRSEGDNSEKEWNENLLIQWEAKLNHGKPWLGRLAPR